MLVAASREHSKQAHFQLKEQPGFSFCDFLYLFSFVACHKQLSKSHHTRGMARSSCSSPLPGNALLAEHSWHPQLTCLLRVHDTGASAALGLCPGLWAAQNPEWSWLWSGLGLFLCPPTGCRSWGWAGAKLQTGRGWLWRIYISNRTDVCFLSSQTSARMLYFGKRWAVL